MGRSSAGDRGAVDSSLAEAVPRRQRLRHSGQRQSRHVAVGPRGQTLRSEVADAWNTVEWALWSESGVGTNAVETALAAGCPPHVRGAEHFSEAMHRGGVLRRRRP
jgi:hypothetical protein